MVKIIREDCNCVSSSSNRNANAKWIFNKLIDELKTNPNMSYDLIYTTLSKKYILEPKPWLLYRVKVKDRIKNEGFILIHIPSCLGSLIYFRNIT